MKTEKREAKKEEFIIVVKDGFRGFEKIYKVSSVEKYGVWARDNTLPFDSFFEHGEYEVIVEEKENDNPTLKDSGNRREFETGAVRDIEEGKGRCDLLPAVAILRLAKHFENGAVKYGEHNWQKGIPIHSYIDSSIRHLMNYLDGQVDEDHLCAAAWNLVCAMWTEEKIPEMQDIPTRKKEASFE